MRDLSRVSWVTWHTAQAWDHGLRTLPELSEVQDLRVPREARELSGSPRGPGLPRKVRGRHV
jgi:hypothetical protein